MQFRFRYLRPDGQEAQVESIEGLRDLVRSGAVAHDTLLYDALTSEWAPLRAHAVVRLLEDVGDLPAGLAAVPGAPPSEEPAPSGGRADTAPASDAPRASDVPEPADPAPVGEGADAAGPETPTPGDDALGAITLDPAFSTSDGPTTEETVRDLLREREREGAGRSEPAESGAGLHGGLVVDAGFAPPPEPAREPRRAVVTPLPRHDDSDRTEDAPATRASERKRSRAPRALMAVGSAGLLALLLYAVAWSDDHFDAPSHVASVLPMPAAAAVDEDTARDRADEPEPGATTAASLMGRWESSALRDMVGALEGLRRARGLDDVPRLWLEGIYLANASRYPEVEDYWVRYRAFVDEVRQRDTALFRQSFVRRLEGEGVTGAMVPMRLARAIRVFEESQPARDSVYDAMDDLALASLELHRLLVDREEDIVYDPVLPDRVSRDPVVEAVTDDDELRDEMWVLLDRIFLDLATLSGDDARTREVLTERSLDGIRATGGL